MLKSVALHYHMLYTEYFAHIYFKDMPVPTYHNVSITSTAASNKIRHTFFFSPRPEQKTLNKRSLSSYNQPPPPSFFKTTSMHICLKIRTCITYFFTAFKQYIFYLTRIIKTAKKKWINQQVKLFLGLFLISSS